MTHVVTSDHVESLRSGRLVGPGEEVSDTEAQENPKLIERGVLAQRDKDEVEEPAEVKDTPAPEAEQKPKPARAKQHERAEHKDKGAS